jgi:hypothetical protein
MSGQLTGDASDTNCKTHMTRLAIDFRQRTQDKYRAALAGWLCSKKDAESQLAAQAACIACTGDYCFTDGLDGSQYL